MRCDDLVRTGAQALFPDVSQLEADDVRHLSDLFAVHAAGAHSLDRTKFQSFLLEGFASAYSVLDLAPGGDKGLFKTTIRSAIASGSLIRGIPEEALSRLLDGVMAWFDIRREGSVSLDAVLHGMSRLKKAGMDEQAAFLFTITDHAAYGAVNRAEMEACIASIAAVYWPLAANILLLQREMLRKHAVRDGGSAWIDSMVAALSECMHSCTKASMQVPADAKAAVREAFRLIGTDHDGGATFKEFP